MTVRQQWSEGLEWGACAWIGYRVALTAFGILSRWRWTSLLEAAGPSSLWLPGALWLVSLVLVVAGSRWARLAVAVAVLAQAASGLGEASARWKSPDFPLSWVLISILPACVPALPLIVLRAERPRVVLALLALGRWREAWARSGGVVAVLVAACVLASNRAALDLLRGGVPTAAALLGAAAVASIAQGKRAFPATWSA